MYVLGAKEYSQATVCSRGPCGRFVLMVRHYFNSARGKYLLHRSASIYIYLDLSRLLHCNFTKRAALQKRTLKMENLDEATDIQGKWPQVDPSILACESHYRAFAFL